MLATIRFDPVTWNHQWQMMCQFNGLLSDRFSLFSLVILDVLLWEEETVLRWSFLNFEFEMAPKSTIKSLPSRTCNVDRKELNLNLNCDTIPWTCHRSSFRSCISVDWTTSITRLINEAVNLLHLAFKTGLHIGDVGSVADIPFGFFHFGPWIWSNVGHHRADGLSPTRYLWASRRGVQPQLSELLPAAAELHLQHHRTG